MKSYDSKTALLHITMFVMSCFADQPPSDFSYRLYYSNSSQKVPFKVLNMDKGMYVVRLLLIHYAQLFSAQRSEKPRKQAAPSVA